MSSVNQASLSTDSQVRKVAKVEGRPSRNPDPAFCSYYVSRKHRFCRTECKAGSLFCCTHHIASEDKPSTTGQGEVQPSACQSGGTCVSTEAESRGSVGSSGDVRVPCPINPNHTVYASRLAKHVTVCPDLRFVTDQLPYYSPDKHANRGAVFDSFALPDGSGKTTAVRRTHRDLCPESLAALIEKVDACYTACVEPQMVKGPLCTVESEHEAADGREGGASSSTPLPPLAAHGEVSSQKHGPQHTALLRCLSDVVLQSNADDSILSRYRALPSSGASGDAASTRNQKAEGAMHVDGFVEFGAGKGGLSVALQQLLIRHHASLHGTHSEGETAMAAGSGDAELLAAPAAEWSPFLERVAARPPLVVLDMDSFRRKGDARVRHSALPLRRLRINIKDVDLTAAFLHEIRPPSSPTRQAEGPTDVSGGSAGRASVSLENWAALGKHLCGACTDFALSCLTEAPSLATAAHVRLPIVVIATCCHHRCELRHLNPPETVSQGAEPATLRMPGSDIRWTAAEFAALASMSSWAVCGGAVDETRRVTGRRCKRIIDQLRVHFLRRLGYVAFQCQYTDRAITEENVCIVAYQPEAVKSE